eukprot:TRINITY_DN17418_c0_g1_i1.p2 TRINITY_DN17418_c0_g1~~TRINITY_DN17418_c0_g1_i1.p2  ORF type:complete len:115 (-),score=12.00 TRINITY_DN17418_c0_g1_i1:269-613(-)
MRTTRYNPEMWYGILLGLVTEKNFRFPNLRRLEVNIKYASKTPDKDVLQTMKDVFLCPEKVECYGWLGHFEGNDYDYHEVILADKKKSANTTNGARKSASKYYLSVLRLEHYII